MTSNIWIRKALKEAGLTQKELANKLGVDPTVLSHKLHGRREFLYSEVVLICEILKIDNPLPLFETKKLSERKKNPAEAGERKEHRRTHGRIY